VAKLDALRGFNPCQDRVPIALRHHTARGRSSVFLAMSTS
jgi:hypothetical protein